MSADETQTPPPSDAPAEPQPPARERRGGWAETKMDLKWATPLLLFAILGLSGLLHADWQKGTAGTEDLDRVTDVIFSANDYAPNHTVNASATAAAVPKEPGLIVPFEILSALLLAALVAGVVIALREREGDP